MAKYKVGDVVKVINNHPFWKGRIFTIEKIQPYVLFCRSEVGNRVELYTSEVRKLTKLEQALYET